MTTTRFYIKVTENLTGYSVNSKGVVEKDVVMAYNE